MTEQSTWELILAIIFMLASAIDIRRRIKRYWGKKKDF